MKDWWKEAVVYQIYPRSFADSNGDGIGDLNGITSKLDYLKNLGVDVIWLSPIYESPGDDNGYDISNYRKISKKFGTIDDFDRLLEETHSRGMKLILDGVFNHTSDEHEWFKNSRKSKTGKYRNYYFWRKGKNSKEPNNWRSHFGGPAWEYDKKTGEYYLHLFSKKQPDLNWDNKEVREEIYKTLKWWLDKGVDGFRFDVINLISKTPGLPDFKSDQGEYYVNGPNVNAYLREMNEKVLSKYDIMTVGETAAKLNSIAFIRQYVNARNRELNMVFHENNEIEGGHKNSSIIALERRKNRVDWKFEDLKRDFTAWQKGLEGDCWDSVYLGNHDYPRIVSRFGDDGKYREESAKMLATLLFTLRGTVFIYEGEELGMTNANFNSIKDYRDIASLNGYKEYVSNYNDSAAALRLLEYVSRDNARTPMHWNGGKNAGFTNGSPWIKINDNYREINANMEIKDKNSVLNYYRRIIRLHRTSNTFVHGRYEIMLKDDPKIYAYTRTLDKEKLLVILNFTKGNATFIMPRGISSKNVELIIGNYDVNEKEAKKIKLRPYEARVYRIGA